MGLNDKTLMVELCADIPCMHLVVDLNKTCAGDQVIPVQTVPSGVIVVDGCRTYNAHLIARECCKRIEHERMLSPCYSRRPQTSWLCVTIERDHSSRVLPSDLLGTARVES